MTFYFRKLEFHLSVCVNGHFIVFVCHNKKTHTNPEHFKSTNTTAFDVLRSKSPGKEFDIARREIYNEYISSCR